MRFRKFISDPNTSIITITSLLSSNNKIAVFDIHGTLVDRGETKMYPEVHSSINLAIREEFGIVLVVNAIWSKRTENSMREVFKNYKRSILVLTKSMRRELMSKLNNKSKDIRNKLDALFILRHTTKTAIFYFISDEEDHVQAWKANGVMTVEVDNGITLNQIKLLQGNNVRFVTGENVTVNILSKYLSKAKMLIGIDVHSTLLNHNETKILPEAKAAVDKVVKRGYPIFIATNGVWSKSMKRQLEQIFVDVARKQLYVIVLDWENRKQLSKTLGIKVDPINKIDIVRMLEKTNPAAALVLIDNSEHNIKGWESQGKLVVYTKNGITKKSIDEIHSDEDLDVNKKTILIATEGIQQATRTDTYYDFIKNKHISTEQELMKYEPNEISHHSSHPVVGNLIVYFNIWLPLMKYHMNDFQHEDLKPQDERFKIKLITKDKTWDLGKETFLSTRAILEIFGIINFSEEDKKIFYKIMVNNIQRDLNNRYSNMDVYIQTTFDKENLYLHITNFDFDLIYDHLDNRARVPFLWHDQKFDEFRAVFETLVPQGKKNVPMKWHALLDPSLL